MELAEGPQETSLLRPGCAARLDSRKPPQPGSADSAYLAKRGVGRAERAPAPCGEEFFISQPSSRWGVVGWVAAAVHPAHGAPSPPPPSPRLIWEIRLRAVRIGCAPCAPRCAAPPARGETEGALGQAPPQPGRRPLLNTARRPAPPGAPLRLARPRPQAQETYSTLLTAPGLALGSARPTRGVVISAAAWEEELAIGREVPGPVLGYWPPPASTPFFDGWEIQGRPRRWPKTTPQPALRVFSCLGQRWPWRRPV